MKKLINGLIVGVCVLSLGQKMCARSAPVEPAVPSASQKEWAAAREDFRKKTSSEYIQEQDRKLQEYLNKEHAQREQAQQAPQREQARKEPRSRGGSRREFHRRDSYGRYMKDYQQQPEYKK